MQFNGHCGEIIGSGIQLDETSVLLQEAEAQADDITNEHSDKQDAQRATQKHLANEFVARTHGFQQTYGWSAFNDDNQQHADNGNARHKQHQSHDEPDIGV